MNSKKLSCADCLYSIDIRDDKKYYCSLHDKGSIEQCDDFKKTVLSNLGESDQ